MTMMPSSSTSSHMTKLPGGMHSIPGGHEESSLDDQDHCTPTLDSKGIPIGSKGGSKLRKKLGKIFRPNSGRRLDVASGTKSSSFNQGSTVSSNEGDGLGGDDPLLGYADANIAFAAAQAAASLSNPDAIGSAGNVKPSSRFSGSNRGSVASSASSRGSAVSKRSSGVTSVCHDYTDYSDLPESEQGLPPELDIDNTLRKRNTGGVITPFPEKLHEMLTINQYPEIVSWAPHGRCFLVKRPREFESTVMPLHFNHTKITSFQRQLNLYGFKRITRGVDRGAYYHELFLRGRPKLCTRMRRQKVKGTGHKPLPDPDNEPNFYAMKSVTDLPPQSDSGGAAAAAPQETSGSEANEDPLAIGGGQLLDQPTDFPRSYLSQMKRRSFAAAELPHNAENGLAPPPESAAQNSFGDVPGVNTSDMAALSAMTYGAVNGKSGTAQSPRASKQESAGLGTEGNSKIDPLSPQSSTGRSQPEPVPSEVHIKDGRQQKSSNTARDTISKLILGKKIFRRSSARSKCSDVDMHEPELPLQGRRSSAKSMTSKGSSIRRRRSQSSIEMGGSSSRRLSAGRLSITSIGSFRRLSITSIGTSGRRFSAASGGTTLRRMSITSWESCGSLNDAETEMERQRRASIHSGNGLHLFKQQVAATGVLSTSEGSEEWIEDQVHRRRLDLEGDIDFDGIFDEVNKDPNDAASV